MIIGQIDEEGIQSLRQKNMNKILSELCQYSRGTAREMNNKTRILRKMELTRIEETQSDATADRIRNCLKGFSYEPNRETVKCLVECMKCGKNRGIREG